jgi:hypothetical protein
LGGASVARSLEVKDVKLAGNVSDAGAANHAYFECPKSKCTVVLDAVRFEPSPGVAVELGKFGEEPSIVAKNMKWPL